MSCASALIFVLGQASSPRPGASARSTNRCQTLARRGTASVPGGLLWAVYCRNAQRVARSLTPGQGESTALLLGPSPAARCAPVWATLRFLLSLSTAFPAACPLKDGEFWLPRWRPFAGVEIDIRSAVGEADEIRINRQGGGRSTGPRTRTEPAFWALLGRVRPTRAVDRGSEHHAMERRRRTAPFRKLLTHC